MSILSFFNHKDQDSRQLALDLPNIIMQDKAQSTIRSYFYAFRKWQTWANKYSATVLPASQRYFTLYLVHLIKTCSSILAFNTAIYSVAWAHKKFGFNSPSDSHLPKQVIQAGHRILGKATVNRKLPLERRHIRMLQDKFAHNNLAELQIVMLITLGFVGFFQWDVLSALKRSGLTLSTNYLVVFLEKGKTINLDRALGYI